MQARLLESYSGSLNDGAGAGNRPPSLSFARSASLASKHHAGAGGALAAPAPAVPGAPPTQAAGALVLWLFFLQILAVLLFCVLSFVLPLHVPYLTGDNAAIHVAAIHSVMFFVVIIMWLVIRGFDYARAPRHFPLNRNLAELNAIITIVANAILLLCLGVEDWVKQETAHYDFSVLAVVQVLGLAELALVTLSGAGCVWRCILYLRNPSAPSGGGGGGGGEGGGLGLLLGGSGRTLSAAPETPRPSVHGGTATQRLQERVRQLEEKEAELLRQMSRLAVELAQASSMPGIEEEGGEGGEGSAGAGAASPSPSHLARVVQALTQQQAAASAAARESEERMQQLEARHEYYESELRRASAEANALLERVRERKRESEKLQQLLDQEREHVAQAQALIEDYRDRLASPTLGAGAGGGGGGSLAAAAGLQSTRASMSLAAAVASAADAGSSSGSSSSSGGGLGSATPGAFPGTARSASRASFAAMQTPAPGGLGRTLSRSGLGGAAGSLPAAASPAMPNFSASP